MFNIFWKMYLGSISKTSIQKFTSCGSLSIAPNWVFFINMEFTRFLQSKNPSKWILVLAFWSNDHNLSGKMENSV